MTGNEQIFWDRVIQLAQENLPSSTYEYFVLSAKLREIKNKVAHIEIEDVKQVFWQEHIEKYVLTAGFEIFNEPIGVEYIDPASLSYANEDTLQASDNMVSEASLPIIDSNINPKYTFDNFIQGEENRWAVAASRAVIDRPGNAYNPLFIYGGPGLGKTHLLNAIANEVLKINPNARVQYITAENFVNEFIKAISSNSMENFKAQYRSLDYFLIDDIQSLTDKAKSQDEFFNTFNELHSKDKQIILTSDRQPGDLSGLEDRLVSRFEWGLKIQITPPNYETRVAILRNKVKEYDFECPPETIEYLAGHFNSNVRELEGALKSISLIAEFHHKKVITVDLASEAIRGSLKENTQTQVVPIEKIQTETGKFYGVTVKEIKGTKRPQNIVLARQVAMYLSREITNNSLPKIGKEFGGRDHTTVMHACKKIQNMLATDDNLRIEVDTIKKKLI